MNDFKRMKQLLDYNPMTGTLVRRDKVKGKKPSAVPGFRMVIEGKLYHRSHLAWLLSNGDFPKSRVYHVDGDNTNLRLANLSLLKPRKKTK
jgi:HNH endonuclease